MSDFRSVRARLGLPFDAKPSTVDGALLDRIEALEHGRPSLPPLGPDEEQRLWERGEPILIGLD